MRGSSSFSTPDYRGRLPPFRRDHSSREHGGPYNHTRRREAFSLTKLRHRSGNVMHCSFCSSWFYLVRDCPKRERAGKHYSDELHPRNLQPLEPVGNELNFEFDRCENEYSLSQPHDPGRQKHEKNLFLSLTRCREHKPERHPQLVHMYKAAEILPILNDVLKRHPNLKPNLIVYFYEIRLDEGAPQSETGKNQSFAYLRNFNLPAEFHNIHQFQTVITFGRKGKQKVEVFMVGQ